MPNQSSIRKLMELVEENNVLAVEVYEMVKTEPISEFIKDICRSAVEASERLIDSKELLLADLQKMSKDGVDYHITLLEQEMNAVRTTRTAIAQQIALRQKELH